MPARYDGPYRRPPTFSRDSSTAGPHPGDELYPPPPFYPDEFAGATYGKRLDEQLRTEVRMRLFEDTWLDARHIRLEVSDAVVLLRGKVRTHMEARYACDDAWETPGVRGVIDRLEVEEPIAGSGAG